MSDRNYRFYHPVTLEVISEVARSKPKKLDDGSMSTTRAATIKDARIMGLLESVTSILDETFATSHTLIDWINEQTIDACMAFPPQKLLETDSEKEEYRKMIIAKSNEYRDFTAGRGKFIHSCVNRWIELKTMSDDPVCNASIDALDSWLKANKVVTITSEKKMGSKELGFAGTPDIHCVCEDGSKIIVDIKTTSLKTFKKPYEKWLLQLGAYRMLTASEAGTRLVQMVIDRNTGEVLFLEHEDPDKWGHAFMHLLEVRFVVSDHDPRKTCSLPA